MYRITYDGLTIFDPYGNANEVVSDASMSVEVNASAYLDFTMAITHPLYDTIRERAGVVTLTWDSTVLFEGIIESIEMDIQGNKSISCVSAMDYLNDTHVRPYSTVAGEADLTAPSSVDGYFQWLIDQHNDHVLDASKMFDIGINQGANLQQNNFIYRSSESEPTTASELTDQILDSLGGYLTMRYEDGRKVLDLYADLHTMNAQIVDFGVNITDFTKTTDTTDQCTAILLHGGSPTFEGGDLEGGDWSHWETHPNTPLVGDKTHGGSVASYFVSGTGEYINDSFFYSRPGRRYKATVYVKNERGSNVTIRGSYQYEQAGGWTTVNVNSSLAVENKDDQWVEFSFDFQPNLSEYTKIRPRWYFDNVGNDGNRRVYLDDFSFSQIEGDTEVSEDPIGLKQVPDGVSSFDADVFKSGDVLYSTSAVERYGYKEEVFEDTTITNINDLVQAGIKELNKSKDPQITLDIKAVDLALFIEGYTHLNVGDAVRVRSAIHDTDEFLMVNSIKLDLQDPGQSEYVIGKAHDSLTGQQSGFLRSLNSGINSSLDAMASLDQTTKDQAIQIGSVEQVANQAQQTANAAQNTANTANSNAQNAQNRVGNLETCIKMTSDGVRVGKISNGNFTGYSALVNSAGSFDILDSSTKTLASFNKDGLRVNSSSDRGMLIGFNPKTNSGYIGSTPKLVPSTGGEQIDIGMNMEFSKGGHLNILNNLGGVGLTGNGVQLIATGDKRVSINLVDVRGAGIVLFDKDDNHNYSSIIISPGHNFSEFNYIMCFFKTNDGQYFGGTAYHPNGKEYCFTTMGGGAGTTDMSYLKGTRWAFNGNTATRKTTFEIGPGYSTIVNDAVLHIVAIVGFDYYKTSG